jgi:hypothetical protein
VYQNLKFPGIRFAEIICNFEKELIVVQTTEEPEVINQTTKAILSATILTSPQGEFFMMEMWMEFKKMINEIRRTIRVAMGG